RDESRASTGDREEDDVERAERVGRLVGVDLGSPNPARVDVGSDVAAIDAVQGGIERLELGERAPGVDPDVDIGILARQALEVVHQVAEFGLGPVARDVDADAEVLEGLEVILDALELRPDRATEVP